MSEARLTIVQNELEAEMLCSMLRTEGIRCFYRKTDFGAGASTGIQAAGPTEIVVDAADLERARELIAAATAEE